MKDEIIVTTDFGELTINKEDIECCRGISSGRFNSVLYMRDGHTIYVYETFGKLTNLI